jgi:hypothetical protein
VRTTLGVVCAAALAGALGACAALSGLGTYASEDCQQPCDGGLEGNSPSGDGEVLAAEAAIGTDAARVADAEPDRDAGAGGHESGALDGGADVTDAQSDTAASDVASDGASDAGSDAGLELDAGSDAAASDAETDAGSEAGPEAGADANDGGDLAVGLVAFYHFDETSGTTAADSSGNNRTATLVGGATFSGGLQNNAVTMNGRNEYVSLPSGIVSGLTSFSICAWVNLNAITTWSRIFDFGTGTTAYMFVTPSSGAGVRFGITTGGNGQEQQMNAPALATGSWQQVAVTRAPNTGTLYVNGVLAAQNTSMTLNPVSLGTTTQNWLGRSEFAGDPYLNGQIDNFRIYDHALTAAEVQTLYAGHL